MRFKSVVLRQLSSALQSPLLPRSSAPTPPSSPSPPSAPVGSRRRRQRPSRRRDVPDATSGRDVSNETADGRAGGYLGARAGRRRGPGPGHVSIGARCLSLRRRRHASLPVAANEVIGPDASAGDGRRGGTGAARAPSSASRADKLRGPVTRRHQSTRSRPGEL